MRCALIALLMIGMVCPVFSGPLLAQGCQIDGSGVMVGLPDELADVLSGTETGSGKGVCVAPSKASLVKKKKATTTRSVPKYQGSIVAIQGEHVLDEVVVSLAGGQEELEQLAQDYRLEVRSSRFMAVVGGLIVRFGIPDGRPVALVRAALKQDPLILEAVPNHVYELNEEGGSKESSLLDRYSLKVSGIQAAHKLARGRGVKIAIIDSGVDVNHPALSGAIGGVFDGLEKVPLKTMQHGTVVALLAGGAKAPFVGAAPEASLFVARAFDETEKGRAISSVYSVIDGLNWAMGQDVDVINMSFSGPENKLMTQALATLMQSNVVLVAAAGNGGARAPYSYPAAIDGVYAVTAIDAKNRIYNKANQGAYVVVAAPGVDLMVPAMGADSGQEISFKTGTSYGAALFSGICALVLEGRGKIKSEVFRQILARSVKDLGKPGRDKVFGFGLVRAQDFVRQASQ